MYNEFEKKSGQKGHNQSEGKKSHDPQAKQGQAPAQKSVLTGTSGEDKKQPDYGQSASRQTSQPSQQQTGFSQYGESGGQPKSSDFKNETPFGSRSESIGYQAGVNAPGRDQQQDPQARQGAPGRESEVPRPEREGQDLEHLRNPDKTISPERKEIDPVANSKRESQQDISKNPSGQDQSNPIL